MSKCFRAKMSLALSPLEKLARTPIQLLIAESQYVVTAEAEQVTQQSVAAELQ